MNIGYVSSNEYAPYVGTSMYSLFDKNKEVDKICVYILDAHISEDNKNKMRSIAQKFRREIVFISDREKTVNELRDVHHFDYSHHKTSATLYTYGKLLPGLLFDDGKMDRILIIDSDIIINHSLKELYDMDLEDHYLAAVPEISAYYVSSEYKEIIYKNKFYYNSGFLLWNLKKIREDNFNQRVFDAKKAFTKPLKLSDQSLLNLTLTDSDVVSLPLKYNYNLGLHTDSARREKIYKQYADNGLLPKMKDYNKKLPAKEIYVLHFLGARRPWIKYRYPPFVTYFLWYWRKTPWKSMPRESFLDTVIKDKVKRNPNALAGKGKIGRAYAAAALTIERYCPQLFATVRRIKQKIVKKFK